MISKLIFRDAFNVRKRVINNQNLSRDENFKNLTIKDRR